MGVDTRTLKDVNGKAFGQELYDAYQKPEGQITEVSYMWVRPGPDKTQVQKVSFATKVGDLGCPEVNDPRCRSASSISELRYPASFCQLETVRMRSAVGGREEPKPGTDQGGGEGTNKDRSLAPW
jgi:hypothetical protein